MPSAAPEKTKPQKSQDQSLDQNIIFKQMFTVQSDGSEEEDDKYEVGERGSEVDDLAGALDTLDETPEDDKPGGQKTEGQVPLDVAHLLDPRRLL